MLQSGYGIQTPPKCEPIDSYCKEMKELNNIRIIFLYETFNKIQFHLIKFINFTNDKAIKPKPKLPYSLKEFDNITEDFWPKGWATKGQTHKPAAFWPKLYYFIHIINGKTPKDNAVLATNSLLNKDWTNSWIRTEIKGFKGMQFTSAFWWKKSDSIYVVIENKTDNRQGFVYEFDEKNLKNPFIPTVSLEIIVLSFLKFDFVESFLKLFFTSSLNEFFL
jgi:hypothetical protein